MTQIRKAFEEAARQHALSNFRATFRTALKEEAAQALEEKIDSSCILRMTSKNLQSLKPAKALKDLLTGINNAMEQLFANAARKAHVASYHAAYGKAYNSALDKINRQYFRPSQTELIADFLMDYGSPVVVFAAANGIFQAFFAQTLLGKLIIAAQNEPNGKFDEMLNIAIDKAIDATLFTMLEISRATEGQPYIATFVKQFLSELITLYKAEDRHEHLNGTIKGVLSAYVNHR